MIIVCEPICKGHSHEKFNTGFLHGLRQAYPQEKILFYADISHILTIKSILERYKITLENIEYIPIKFWPTESLAALIRYYFLFKRILADVCAKGSDKLFLLCFSSSILYILKRLKKRQVFSRVKFTLVCHGEFEYIADDYRDKEHVQADSGRPFLEKIRKINAVNITRKILNAFRRCCYATAAHWSGVLKSMFRLRFSLKEMLLWQRSGDFKYILLGPHVIENTKKYIDVNGLDFHTVVLPTPFPDPLPCPVNKFVKFAVFGYGYAAMIQKVLASLSNMQLNSPYEIRIIGGNNRGTEGYPNIICPHPNKALSREEMERYVPDIDVFLVLYDKSLYRLSCSGSIMEALSYMKPVLHFENDCINAFNKKERPIGICCESVENMAVVMADIINNYSDYILKFKEYRLNILTVRKKVAIDNNLQALRDGFTW